MGTIDELVSKVHTSESITLEFKSAKGGFPKSFWETYSAFANTQGGIIYLGVRENKKEYVIDGLSLEQINMYKKELWDNLNNTSKVSANVLNPRDIQEIKTEHGYVLEISVPRAPLKKRPVYIKGTPTGNTFKRHGEGDYVCSPDEISRMYAEANLSETPQDSRILSDFTFEDDIDQASFYEYRRLFSTMNPTHPWAAIDDISFLTKLGGYRRDRRTGEEGLTLAGMLMFGKFCSITDNYCCPHYFPDYREYNNNSDSERWSDRICYDGSWEANLFQFYRRVYNKLSQSLPKPFALKDGRRIDDSPMHVAIREAFVNCLIHCDYTVNSNIIVESCRNKFIFTNPGSLLISLSQYFEGGESKCRNKALQQMFMHIGNAEKAGSGVDKIVKGWKAANYRYPSIQEIQEKVRLILPLESILSENVQSALKTIYGDDVLSINHEELLVLAACVSEGFTSNYRMQLVLEKHPSDITQLLKVMCQKGFLVSSGIGKGTTYHLNDNYIIKVSQDTNVSISRGESSVTKVGGIPFSTSSDEVSSFVNVESSSSNMESSANNVDSSLLIPRKKRGKVSSRQLQMQIIAVCRDDYKSLEDIAKGVGKTIKYLNNGFIARMVLEGLLERRFPDIPTHPGQQYRARRREAQDDTPTLF